MSGIYIMSSEELEIARQTIETIKNTTQSQFKPMN